MRSKYLKNLLFNIWLIGLVFIASGQDWDSIAVPANPGEGKVWQLQSISDDFNYEAPATKKGVIFSEKWTDSFHNAWTGPSPTVWKKDHSYVNDGKLKIRASRPSGTKTTNTGCITSKKRVVYPVYVEAMVKLCNSVLASDVWMLSPDDTQEIDICEAYGSDRWNNEWFSSKRLHLSHHVFIRTPFQDWQPNDEGSFYTNGSTVWRNNYHRIGVYWKDPWNLEYYVDGVKVRSRSGMSQIDPKNYTNGKGLSKEMDIIINTEDQTWRANQGLSPTLIELENEDNNTFKVDWIRIYKPVGGEVGPVKGVILNKTKVDTYIGASFKLEETLNPINANDASVTWSSDKPEIASVSKDGMVSCLSEGVAIITVTTIENKKTATCMVSVSKEIKGASLALDNESKYLNTIYKVEGKLEVSCSYHAGTGNIVVEGGLGGMKFWLREMTTGWSVVKDYVISDASVIGTESGIATGSISLNNVLATSEIPKANWYFLYVMFKSSDGSTIDKGIYPIKISRTTGNNEIRVKSEVKIFPNPVQSYLNIENHNSLINGNLQILSILGQPLFSTSLFLNRIDVSFLEKGFYFLKIDDENYVRFIKE